MRTLLSSNRPPLYFNQYFVHTVQSSTHCRLCKKLALKRSFNSVLRKEVVADHEENSTDNTSYQVAGVDMLKQLKEKFQNAEKTS